MRNPERNPHADALGRGYCRGSVVWTGSNPAAEDAGRSLRLYHETRENLRPDAAITSLDVVSTLSRSAPFFSAITVE